MEFSAKGRLAKREHEFLREKRESAVGEERFEVLLSFLLELKKKRESKGESRLVNRSEEHTSELQSLV